MSEDIRTTEPLIQSLTLYSERLDRIAPESRAAIRLRELIDQSAKGQLMDLEEETEALARSLILNRTSQFDDLVGYDLLAFAEGFKRQDELGYYYTRRLAYRKTVQ